VKKEVMGTFQDLGIYGDLSLEYSEKIGKATSDNFPNPHFSTEQVWVGSEIQLFIFRDEQERARSLFIGGSSFSFSRFFSFCSVLSLSSLSLSLSLSLFLFPSHSTEESRRIDTKAKIL